MLRVVTCGAVVRAARVWVMIRPNSRAGGMFHLTRASYIVVTLRRPAMRHPLGSRIALGALLLLWRTLVFAQPSATLNADYWRGGWRTPLGDEPHIYEFVIRANRVTGVYCRNCADASTIGFIDGTWSETAGIDFTVTFANADGRIRSVEKQHAALTNGRLIISGVRGTRSGKALTLVKDPRGADPGGAPAYYLPPGTPPARPVVQPAGGGGGRGGAPRPTGRPVRSRRYGRRTWLACGSLRSAWG